MTNEQLFEELAPYLPYGLKGEYVLSEVINLHPTQQDEKRIIEFTMNNVPFFLHHCKPIFRPLSDLTKPCLEGGLVPIVELLRIAYKKAINEESNLSDICFLKNGYGISAMSDCDYLIFNIYLDLTISLTLDSRLMKLSNLEIIKQLHKWHFWLGDQSEFGKSIIDINTVQV